MTERITNNKVAVIGLGYVGLPLLCHTSPKYPSIGSKLSKRNSAENNNSENTDRKH